MSGRKKATAKKKRGGCRYPKYTKAQVKAITDRADFLRSLLSDFGAVLSGFDPGVSANLKGFPPGCSGAAGNGYWGEHLNFNAAQWGWLEPLLVELRQFRVQVGR